MAELTPMKRQYQQIKQQHQDCLLFFRLGDPICTSLAPSWVSSFANTVSRPMNVLAIISKVCSIKK